MGGLNATDIRFIFHLMSTFQLLGSKWFDTQTEVHTESQNTHVSLAMEFQNNLVNESLKHGIIDNVKHTKKAKILKLDRHGASCAK